MWKVCSIIMLVTFIVFLYSCQDYKKVELNPNFRAELVRSLDLKLVATDSLFYSSNMKIANDTIFGYYRSLHNTSYDDIAQNYYFIKHLNSREKIFKIHSDFSHVDTLDRGKIYFSTPPGCCVITLDTNGRQKEYFAKYQDSLFMSLSMMLYNNRVGIRSMNGLYVFDLLKQKLIWKYKFPSTGIVNGKIILGKLFFELSKNENKINSVQDSIYCLDLDSGKYSWKIGLKGEDFRGDIGAYKINANKKTGEIEKRIYISTNRRALVLNLETRKILYSEAKFSSIQPTNKEGYLLARKDDECFLLNQDYEVLWKVKNFVPVGFHRDYIIGTSLDKRSYYVLNTATGKQIAKILKNNPDDIEFFMMSNNYILIDKIHLYN
jgi:outer membrane protein assembly factor BamB